MEDSRELKRYREWLNAKGMDASLRKELYRLISDPEEIRERFCRDLNFGTAGLRALTGAGTNRLNRYTVAKAVFGYAQYLRDSGEEESECTVVISYDSRLQSREFAEISAAALAESGVKVLLSDALRPVPMLSYAIRHYAAAGGIMITASHNPKEYNGLKIYGADGGQLTPESADQVKAAIDAVDEIFERVEELEDVAYYAENGSVCMLGDELDRGFDDYVVAVSGAAQIAESAKKALRITYTPLNGSGSEPMRRIMKRLGFEKLTFVSEQEKPNGEFPTLRVPNPEFEDTFDLARNYARLTMSELIIATDPDADRLGVAVKDQTGEFRVLSGNRIGLLLMEYILSTKARAGTLPKNGFCTTSLVSSRIARNICNRYGVTLYETPTGSKYMAELIREKDQNGEEHFLFGFEEGHGYLFGTEVCDKDAVTAAVVIASMAAESKARGKSLYEDLEGIFDLYGYAAEKCIALTREGEQGLAAIKSCMAHYRALNGALGRAGSDLSYKEVKKYTDFLPETDMLLYELDGLDWIAMRPSGTEPKLKLYFAFYGARSAAESRLERISALLLEELDRVLDEEKA